MGNTSESPLRESPRKGQVIPRDFYARRPDLVARELLGARLVVDDRSCIIVETEAYFGDCDPGSRARRYKSGRIRKRLFGEPGILLVYGMHGWYLANIVAHEPGSGGAVLVRSCLVGGSVVEGPGRVSRVMGISLSHDGLPVWSGPVRVYFAYEPVEVSRHYRVNVASDFDVPLRFAVEGLFRPRRFNPRGLVPFTLC